MLIAYLFGDIEKKWKDNHDVKASSAQGLNTKNKKRSNYVQSLNGSHPGAHRVGQQISLQSSIQTGNARIQQAR